MNRFSRRRSVFASTKIIVFLLLFTLLTNTVFAAPEASRTLIASAGEMGRSIRFSYLASGVGASLGGWTNNLMLLFKGKRQTEQISRIEIRPGDMTIRQGEPTNFTAFGLDANGQRLHGLRFEWTVRDVDRGSAERNLAGGIFRAQRLGNFVVTARARGVEAQVNVVVVEHRPFTILRQIRAAEARGDQELLNRLRLLNRYATSQISSKAVYTPGQVRSIEDETPESPSHGPNAGEAESENSTSKTGSMMRPADEDGWDNDNWWMADDPGNQTGNPTGTSPNAGAGNGNFQLSAPVVSLPGRGIDLSLSLNYNSRVWSNGGNVMSFDADRGFPAPGWNLGFGKMTFMGTSGGCMLIEADGTNRGYTGTIQNYSGTGWSSTLFNGQTTDGTFIDYSCSVSTYSGVTTMGGSSTLPNGTSVAYNTYSANGKQAFPTQITDVQGNHINVSYLNNRGPHILAVTDTMGRDVTFNYDAWSRLTSVDVPKLGGGTRTAVRIHYKSLPLSAGFALPLTADTNNPTPDVVDAIYYPGTGTGYWFNDSDSYSSYGMIAKVLEQRGMSWSGSGYEQGTVTPGTMSKQAVYNYSLTANGSLTDAPTYTTLTESWAGDEHESFGDGI